MYSGLHKMMGGWKCEGSDWPLLLCYHEVSFAILHPGLGVPAKESCKDFGAGLEEDCENAQVAGAPIL